MPLSLQYILRLLFPSLTWRISTNQKVLYLTFDDGPIPEVTPWVLEQLAQYNAKVTFFCIGDNVNKYPDIYKLIIENGHSTGNHTHTHLNAWKNSHENFMDDVQKAEKLIDTKLFRPPYGKITSPLIKALKKKFSIIMWDVLSYDYDSSKNAEYCLNKVKTNSRPGSIIVFHDSLKAELRLRGALPKVLEHFSGLGFTFEAIPNK